MNEIVDSIVEKLDSCPACNSKNNKFWSEAKDLLTQSSDQIFAYSKCLDCKCLYMSTRPIEDDVSFFYSSEYHPYQAELTHRNNNLLFNLLKRYFNPIVMILKLLKSMLMA